ncbi:MAG TPA: hypothetical protein VGI76_09875, partial [Solirubrobacteraceae bacterium]
GQRVHASVPSGALPSLAHVAPIGVSLASALVLTALLLLASRLHARRRRRYTRLLVMPYHADHTSVEGLVSMFESLHGRLLVPAWRRLALGQPSLALEVHCRRADAGARLASLAIVCPSGSERLAEASLRGAYPNCRLERTHRFQLQTLSAVVKLKKRTAFTKRAKHLDRFELARQPPMDRLITTMAACQEDTLVQCVLTPAPALLQRYARHLYKSHEAHLSRTRREHLLTHDRSMVDLAELRGGLDIQHRPLFLLDLRVAARSLSACRQVAAQLRSESAENSLVVRRGRAPRRLLSRVARGEATMWPSLRCIFASTELAALWHAPSVEYSAAPFIRGALPVATASPAIMRPADGCAALHDALGPVCVHPHLRRHHTAVTGDTEQGKTSYLAATVAEDLRRASCAVVVLDPKGDLAEAAIGLVSQQRPCTLLDFANPTLGFNPLAADVPADAIADYVVNALRHLSSDPGGPATGDRYLRGAVIAVLAHDPNATLWDVARMLSVGEDGYAYRARIGAHLSGRPNCQEIAELFTAELAAQLADSRSTTTARLDAPFGKLARLLGSPDLRRVLRADLCAVDLSRVIAQREVLIVQGAPTAMDTAGTSALMQMLLGMLAAALARQHERTEPVQGTALALKVDEAPLVLSRYLTEMLALECSGGIEITASWRTDAQWVDREVRGRLDALFAHRVSFASSSVADARDGSRLMMGAFADVVRPGVSGLPAVGRPDARLHLPAHHAIVSWVTPQGRQPPFLARTTPMWTPPGARHGPSADPTPLNPSIHQPPEQETS